MARFEVRCGHGASLSEEPEQVDCQYLGFNLDALNARRAGHVGSNFPKDPAGKSK
jgi:hypothetical protein